MMLKAYKNHMIICFVLSVVFWFLACMPIHAGTDTPINVMDFGAIGNGTADDRAAIQSAIDAAALGAGGGVIYFPAGTYRVEEILFLKSNITLFLDNGATILNGINQAAHPSIVFMTGPFTEDGEQVTWSSTENITISGGTIDMNGELNASGSGCKNLPNIGSSGAFAFGYCSNVVIQNVTFLDSYKGHAIQLCACTDVSIDNCNFMGQALPNTLTDSQIINLETLQIEPSTTKGFPYALNNTGDCSEGIEITNCYFGASAKCGEPVTAIGTHNQVSWTGKCNDITISNNTFDNMVYAGVRFCGYEDVTIRNNLFIKKSEAQSVNYRDGCFLINAYCYNNTSETLDLNKNITVTGNTFHIADPYTRGIRVAKDKDTYMGNVSGITITNNTIYNTSYDSTDVGIHALRISNDLVISGNTINGGYRGIETQYCAGNITINNNHISNLSYQYVRFIYCGTNQNISFFTHGCGTFNVSTSNSNYIFHAVPNEGYSFIAYYKENALTTLISTNATLTYPINQSTNISRHPLFQ